MEFILKEIQYFALWCDLMQSDLDRTKYIYAVGALG
jgi:hypothetical protein